MVFYKLSRTKILKLLYKSYLGFFHPTQDLSLLMSFRRYITWYRKKSTIDLYKRLCVVCLIFSKINHGSEIND